MSFPLMHPRPDQISELTRSLNFPLPEIQADYLEIIAEGLLRAFTDIHEQAPSTVASGSEAEVTALMEARLNFLIEQDPFWGQLVLCVARGKESLNFDGKHLEKRPDLSIYLTDRNRNFPLIIEAKIFDTATGKTENLYCKQGVRRFINGEYAWYAREAFMIAYVRDTSSICTTLTPFLSIPKNSTQYLVKTPPHSQESEEKDLAFSVHSRTFVYPNKEPPINTPGSITIWHLWLPISDNN